jgi:hypothetical protein
LNQLERRTVLANRRGGCWLIQIAKIGQGDGFAPAQPASQAELLLLHHDPAKWLAEPKLGEGRLDFRSDQHLASAGGHHKEFAKPAL